MTSRRPLRSIESSSAHEGAAPVRSVVIAMVIVACAADRARRHPRDAPARGAAARLPARPRGRARAAAARGPPPARARARDADRARTDPPARDAARHDAGRTRSHSHHRRPASQEGRRAMSSDAKIKPMTPGVPPAARMRAYLAGAVVTLGLVGVAMQGVGAAGRRRRQVPRARRAPARDAPRHSGAARRGRSTRTAGRSRSAPMPTRSGRTRARSATSTGTAEKLAALLDGDAERARGQARRRSPVRVARSSRHARGREGGARREAARHRGRARAAPLVSGARRSAAPVIGRADIDGNGLDGIELVDERSARRQARRGARRCAMRAATGCSPTASRRRASRARPCTLTLDRSIQAISRDGARRRGDDEQGEERRRRRDRRRDRPRARDRELPDLRPELGPRAQGARNKPGDRRRTRRAR